MVEKNSEFINRLQLLMRCKKMSQKSLARASSLNPATISRWKNKGFTPDDKSIQKIVEASGCNFYWLKEDDYQGPIWESERWAFEIGDVTMTPQEVAGFYERIDEIIIALDTNKPKLVEMADLSIDIPSCQPRYFLGDPPGSITINEIANATGYNPDWLLAGKGRRLAKKTKIKLPLAGGTGGSDDSNVEFLGKSVRQIPVISWVQAGDWQDAVEEPATDYVFTDLPNQRMFALRVTGDSMEPKFHDGDIIIIDPDADCIHDAYVVVMNGEGEAIFKQLKIYNDVHVLHPLNDKYEDKVIDSKEMRCIGRAVQKIARERL